LCNAFCVIIRQVDTIWLNCTEEQIEQVHIIFYIRDATLTESDLTWPGWPGRDIKQSVLCTVCGVLNDADGF